MKINHLKKLLSLLLVILAVLMPPAPMSVYSENADTVGAEMKELAKGEFMQDVLSEFPDTPGTDAAELSLEKATSQGGKVIKLTDDSEYTDKKVIISDEKTGTLSFGFNVNNAGLYCFSAEYRVIGTGSDAVRNILIDTKSPYIETENVIFYRMWQDVGEPLINSLGNEVLPQIEEVAVYTEVDMHDGYGYYSTPLIFWLDKGEHTLSLEFVSQEMAIAGLKLKPYSPLPAYKEVYENYPEKAMGEGISTFQAEDSMAIRNSAAIRLDSHGDPSTVPHKYGYKVYNAIGGEAWRKGNQSVTLRFDVEKDGLYKIALRGGQIWDDGMPSYRTVKIDGEIPFKELAEYRFDYTRRLNTFVLGGEEEPYLFYLTKGEHTLTLTATLGDMTDIVQALYKEMLIMSEVILDITRLTGNDPDPNYDYQFFKNLPALEENLKFLAVDIKKQYDNMVDICGRVTGMTSNLVSVYKQLESMIEDPFTIASRFDQITSAQTSISSWYMELQYQSFGLDEFCIAGAESDVPSRKSTLIERLRQTLSNFFLSFAKDYNNVGSILGDDVKITDSIDVWVSRGNEWAESMKELADSSFTSKTGVAVNVRTVPASQLNTGSANVLLLSIISGNAPDVAMGIASNSPVEFAIRDAVVDISSLDGFEEVKERFLPNIMTPFKYNGGVYALPETMNFTVMFYREDISERYGIAIPDTWEDLYHEILPALFKNGMSFYMPNDFAMFLYQHGGSYYTEDGMKSALDTGEAFEAFNEYTQAFTQYGMDVNANFFNRFRTGEIPMGIGNYTLYLQLLTSAPELVGKWSIAAVPGIKRDGTVDRSVGGTAGECDIIIKKDGVTDYSSAWSFLDWWTSEDVQRSYATQIESLIGAESRWNSANLNAFLSLDWSPSHVGVFKEMWNWAKETPVVLGSYYTSRYITNAFTSVVVSGNTSSRDALETAVKAINRELKVKQEEYGVFADE